MKSQTITLIVEVSLPDPLAYANEVGCGWTEREVSNDVIGYVHNHLTEAPALKAAGADVSVRKARA